MTDISGYEVVGAFETFDEAGPKNLVVECPSGKQVLGGAGTAVSTTPGPDGNQIILPVSSQPAHGQGTTDWNLWATAFVVPDDGRAYYAQSFAICGIVN